MLGRLQEAFGVSLPGLHEMFDDARRRRLATEDKKCCCGAFERLAKAHVDPRAKPGRLEPLRAIRPETD